MSKATLGDILRHVGRNLAKEAVGGFSEPLTIPLEAIVRNLEGDDAPGLAEMPEAVAALKKKMTSSYITVTMNRMKELQEINKSVTVKFQVDDDRGVDVVVIGLKDGNSHGERKKVSTDATQYNRGLVAGVDLAISFVPDFIDYTPEQFEIAQKIVKQYRDHLEAFKAGVK